MLRFRNPTVASPGFCYYRISWGAEEALIPIRGEAAMQIRIGKELLASIFVSASSTAQ